MTPTLPQLRLPRQGAGFLLALCALLTLSLAAHAQEPPPQPVEVALGENGGTVTLMTTEAGGYTLDGEAFTGGPDNPVEGTGGRIYVLTLADGTWSAAFVPLTQTVSLGTSGDEVELLTTEAGTWTLAEIELAGDGSDTYTTAGRDYVLELGDDGTWTASFVPTTQSVTLGTSGDTVTLTSTEAGGWALGSSSVADGYVATAENGSRYSLTLGADGTWAAAFVPTAVPVSLGASGESVTLMTTEAGGYTLDGTAVEAGASLTSTVGERYALAVSDDGMWTATHVPDQRTVLLGNSGVTIQLMTSETGTWTRDDASVSSGEIVVGEMNAVTGSANQYELTLADGTWTATYRPATQSIKGTGLTASVREDGQGYTVGAFTLPASGAGELAGPDGALYRVAKGTDGMLAGARFDRPVVGDVMHENAVGTHDAPSLSTNNRKTDADETGTMLEALGASLSMGDLLGDGTATASGPNMVAAALENIVKIRGRVAGLVELRRIGGLDSDPFEQQVGRQWDAADTLVNRLFGTTGATLERTTSATRVVDAFDRLVEALSSEAAFAAATLEDGPNQLQGFKTRNATQAVQAFNRVQWTASSTLGTLGSTRFGAAVYNSTDNVTAGLGDAERAQGFAWSTMESTRRASDVQTSGEAYYKGATHAADQDGNLYEGAIDVQVRFATERVDGLIRELARTDTGALWSYGLGGEVRGISLPTARLNRRGAWSVRTGSAEGRLAYLPRAGGSDDFTFNGGEFSGRLLGRDDAAGEEALGTWKVEVGSSVLAGGFGVERVLSPTQQSAATRAQNRFQAALAAAGLEDGSTVDPEDPQAVTAAVNQFQAALEASGYSAEAVTTAVAAYRSAVVSVIPGQTAFRVALSTFSAAQSAGTLVIEMPTVADDFKTAESSAYRLVLQRSSGNTGVRPAADLFLLTDPDTEPGLAVTAPRTVISSSNDNIVVSSFLRTFRMGNDRRSYDLYDFSDQPRNFYKFTVNRERLFEDGYEPTSSDSLAQNAMAEVKSPTHVEVAREEITKLLGRLRGVIALDGPDASASDTKFANDQRQRIFDDIQEQIRTHLLGPERGLDLLTRGRDATRDSGVLDPSDTTALGATAMWTAHTDYPVSGGVAQDREVLTRIEDVLTALADFDAFEDAFEEGGIFHGKKDTGFTSGSGVDPSASAMWNKSPTRMLLVADSTNMTRMGAWQIHTSAYAAHRLSSWRSGTYSGYYKIAEYGEPFAYSPLEQTDYDSTTGVYPGGVLATYRGRTVAVQHTVFYEGDVEARVQWDPSTVSGDLRVEVSELRSRTGSASGPLQHGLINYSNPVSGQPRISKPGTFDVDTLTFRADITADASGKVSFEQTANLDVAITYSDVPGGTVTGYRDETMWNINSMELHTGRLRVHHSGGNRADGRAINQQQEFIRLFDVASPPAAGTSVSLNAAGIARLNSLASGDWTNADGRLPHKLELLSATYHRPSTGTTGRLVLEFEDGTTLENAVGGFSASGTMYSTDPDGSGPRNQRSHAVWSDPSARGTGFDTFFNGDGKGYLNVAKSDLNLSAEISGMFVGEGPDGPLGLIGTWGIVGTGAHYSSGHYLSSTGGNNGVARIFGSFGADFSPAP